MPFLGEIFSQLKAARNATVLQEIRDGRITDIYEGTGQIQRLVIARAILGYSSAELT